MSIDVILGDALSASASNQSTGKLLSSDEAKRLTTKFGEIEDQISLAGGPFWRRLPPLYLPEVRAAIGDYTALARVEGKAPPTNDHREWKTMIDVAIKCAHVILVALMKCYDQRSDGCDDLRLYDEIASEFYESTREFLYHFWPGVASKGSEWYNQSAQIGGDLGFEARIRKYAWSIYQYMNECVAENLWHDLREDPIAQSAELGVVEAGRRFYEWRGDIDGEFYAAVRAVTERACATGSQQSQYRHALFAYILPIARCRSTLAHGNELHYDAFNNGWWEFPIMDNQGMNSYQRGLDCVFAAYLQVQPNATEETLRRFYKKYSGNISCCNDTEDTNLLYECWWDLAYYLLTSLLELYPDYLALEPADPRRQGLIRCSLLEGTDLVSLRVSEIDFMEAEWEGRILAPTRTLHYSLSELLSSRLSEDLLRDMKSADAASTEN